MTHASLFSGIGGFDLAAEWSGFTNIFNCEWEEFPRKVLKHHFPNAEQYEDIHDFDATNYNGRIDILSGGFPCQPFSVAGQRKGSEDERYLWKEMLRVIGECKPRWVVGENVRGLCNWSNGLVFEEVCSDLEAIGYSVQSFIIPACAVNAPHRRDRVWIVAQNTNGNGWDGSKRKEKPKDRGFGDFSTGDNERIQTDNKENRLVADSDNFRTGPRLEKIQSKNGEVPERNNDAKPGNTSLQNAPDTDSQKRDGRCSPSERERQEAEQRGNGVFSAAARSSKKRNAPDTDSTSGKGERINRQGKRKPIRQSSDTIQDRWEEFPTVPPICGGNDGLPKELDGITFPKWRRESIKAYGNAIVPQVAHRIFESIKEYELLKK